jgi:hypothetical protein
MLAHGKAIGSLAVEDPNRLMRGDTNHPPRVSLVYLSTFMARTLAACQVPYLPGTHKRQLLWDKRGHQTNCHLIGTDETSF